MGGGIDEGGGEVELAVALHDGEHTNMCKHINNQ
jgi:hypothetical protein